MSFRQGSPFAIIDIHAVHCRRAVSPSNAFNKKREPCSVSPSIHGLFLRASIVWVIPKRPWAKSHQEANPERISASRTFAIEFDH
jgi:hypothetical protein